MAKTKKVDLEAQVTHSEEVVQEETAAVEAVEETQEVENEEDYSVGEQEPDGEEDAEVTEQAEPETKNEEYVDYCLPFLPGVDVGESQTVTLNGKNYQVQYGVPTKVPVGVKEILEDMVKQTRLIKDKIDRLSKEEKCIAKFD